MQQPRRATDFHSIKEFQERLSAYRRSAEEGNKVIANFCVYRCADNLPASGLFRCAVVGPDRPSTGRANPNSIGWMSHGEWLHRLWLEESSMQRGHRRRGCTH